MTKDKKIVKQTKSEAFAAKLAALREDYKQKLPEKTSQIETLWQKLRYFNWSDEAFHTLHNLTHMLTGSGKTFGYSELSDRARELERYLKVKIQSTKRPDETEYQKISELIQALIAAVDNPDKTTETEVEAQPLNTALFSTRSQYQIQLVDDDIQSAEYLAQQLINGGYKVNVCHRIRDLYQQLQLTHSDAVIMDIMFPEGSLAGIDAADNIRQTTGKRTPILFMSARSDVTARLQAVRAGGDAYFTKPIAVESMLSRLDEIMLSNAKLVDRVLLIEDDVELAQHYQLVLQQAGKEIQVVNNPMQTIQKLIEFKPDLVLMDINMPEVSGLDLATLINQEGRFVGLPIVFISAAHDPETRARALSIGGDEFLNKPVDDKTLVDVVDRQLIKSRRTRHTIKQVSRQDPQSGLVHRKSFLADLEKAVATSESVHSTAALIYITVESFDVIRAQIGITGLDPLANMFAERILQTIGINAKASQLAETVYVVFAQAADQETILQLTESIMKNLSDTAFTLNKHMLDIQFSMGFSFIDKEYTDVSSLLAEVELAAAKASQRGANKIHQTIKLSFDEPDNHENDIFMDKVKRALEEKSFKLVFQPILNIEDESFEFSEVHCRLFDEHKKIILPQQFLPIAEQLEQRFEIDRWVINQSILRISKNEKADAQTNYLIPISGGSVDKPAFSLWLSNCLTSSRNRGKKQFFFELSEKEIVTRIKEVAKFSKSMKDLSCGFVINDFASTKRGLSLLDQLDIDYVKLSDSTISKIDEDEKSKEALQSLIKTIQSKGIKVIVGSVENPLNMALLWDWGVRFFQGHHIEEPHESLEFNLNQAVVHKPF